MTGAALPIRFRRKAVIYATWRSRLLVFTQPADPGIGLQVPGGTINAGESAEDGARREFLEETGFVAPAALTFLGAATYGYEAGGVRHEHARSYFHATLAANYPERWEWTEQWPDGGDAPILMRFFFLALPEVPELFGGLGLHLPAVRALIETEPMA